MTELSSLFQTGMINKLQLKNRMIMAPLGCGYGHPGGYNTDRYTAFLTERAKGGVGLIITGVARVVDEVGMLKGSIAIYHDKFIPGFRQLAQTIQSYDTKIFMQLHHPGTRGSEHASFPTVAPSAIRHPRTGIIPKELTNDEIKRLILSFGEAARRAKEAGFDGVEIHGGHGYLICQFLSPRTNRRKDAYGGDLKNRTRFACEIIKQVRETVGPDFPVSFKMDGDEFIEGGITPDDAAAQAPFFVKAGVDVLHISAGCGEAAHWITGNYITPSGYLAPLSARIKKAVKVPVIVAAKLGDPLLAARVIRDGMSDFVSLGRSLIADPEIPKKAKEGRLADIRPCLYCNLGCASNRWEGLVRCTVNPACGQELEYKAYPTARAKKVMVIGGGLAGMQASLSLAERGHKVSLYESEDRLGGQWNIAGSFRPDVSGFTKYLSKRMEAAGVKVILNTKVDVELVEELKPDVAIVATGATQILPDIPGVDGKNVVMANDVLLGNVKVGQEVVVIGGRLVGADVAVFLAQKGKKVSLVDQIKILYNVNRTFKLTLKEEMVKSGVYLYPESPVYSITPNGVNIINDGEIVFLKADTVVIAVGSKAENQLARDLQGRLPEVYTIGDSVEPRDSLAAVHEGWKTGNEIQ